MIIKRIGVVKLGLFQGFMGIIMGLLMGLITLLFGWNAPAANSPLGGGMLGHALTAIFMPILYGVFMFIAGIATAAIYNLVANLMGGIEIDVE